MSSQTYNNKILKALLQNYVKIRFNRFYKNLSYLFSQFFLKCFSLRFWTSLIQTSNYKIFHFFTDFLYALQIILKKKFNDKDDFFSLGYFSSSFKRFDLKETLERLTPSSFNISANLSESLILFKNFFFRECDVQNPFLSSRILAKNWLWKKKFR